MPQLRFAAAALLFVVASTLAQDYPTKPVVMLVPFAAGGPTDTVARSLAQGMWTPIIRKAGVYAD